MDDNQKAIQNIKQALRQLATNGVPVGNMIEAMKEIEEKYAELEDERIRKWIRKELESKYVVDNIVNNEMADKAIAYLEKQGEQKPTIYHKFRAGDIIRHKKEGFTCKIDSVDTEYRVSECGDGSHLPFDAEDYYELVEPKE